MAETHCNTAIFSGDDAWRYARQRGITSTDAPVIVGVSPYKKRFRLYHEKRGTVPFTVSETEAMFWGAVLEEPIAQRFARETGATVTNPGRYTVQSNEKDPWLLSTIDRYIAPLEMDGQVKGEFREAVGALGGPGILEIKNAGFYMAEKWHDEPPLDFQVQVQHQLAVTGLTWGAIAGLLGGNKFVWAIVKRDQAFIDKLVAYELQFRQDVAKENEPPTDGSDDTKDLIAALWPSETGEQIVLPVEVLDIHERLTDAKKRIKQGKADEQEASNAIRHLLGDASIGTHASGLVYSLNIQTRAAYASKASTFRVLRCRQQPE